VERTEDREEKSLRIIGLNYSLEKKREKKKKSKGSIAFTIVST